LIFALYTFFTPPAPNLEGQISLYTLIRAASGTPFHWLAGVLRVQFCAGTLGKQWELSGFPVAGTRRLARAAFAS
jgi:hypothetical protein